MLGGTATSYPIKVLIYLAALCVRPCRSGDQPNNPACHLDIMKAEEEYEYLQEGDIMIGGILTLSRSQGEKNMTLYGCKW
ncbi:hypothetical protein XELAEV_18008702mg [Xenopus laevis]|uniref:Uncharacterized protein n=1 Tax=Xenopus laevis TaxID=8355 RepID=A0A974I034_XENLA|nr:hypothetical protein XELAEV_18008702mg [Xenopus laevis]